MPDMLTRHTASVGCVETWDNHAERSVSGRCRTSLSAAVSADAGTSRGRLPDGYHRRMWALLRKVGRRLSRKRSHRPWRRAKLKVPEEQRGKLHLGHRANGRTCPQAQHKDELWAWNFIHHRTRHIRSLKWLTLIDERTRWCLAFVVDRGMKG